MVDFQSRDTRRGPPIDEETETEEEKAAEPDETDTSSEDETEAEPASANSEADATASDADARPAESDAGGTESEAASDPLADDPVAASAPDASEPTQRVESGDATGHGEPTSTEAAPKPERSVEVALVTVDTPEDNGVEDALTTAFESAGHEITVRERLRGEYDTLQQVVDRLVGRGDVDVVVTAGGVGIGPDAVTIEAVHPLLEKALPGFGEAFRSLLFESLGTGIVGVRSTAGVADGTLVFCLPGDTDAVSVAVEGILATEAPALVEQLRE